MTGEAEAKVTKVVTFNLHGVKYYDVEVLFDDGSKLSTRLGHEGVPDGLKAGERVLATRAANMVVSIRRP